MKAWEHPELGRFKFDYTGWAKEFPFPAFEAFKYREFGKPRGRAKLPLEFLAEDDESPKPPSKPAIGVAVRVIKNQHVLAKRLKKAIWNDLHGRGPDSGMWWHGDLNTINENLAQAFQKKKPPELIGPDDLLDILGASAIWVRESLYRYERPSATICFESAFEIEHGVGVLTDGTRIRGIGYRWDVGPFV